MSAQPSMSGWWRLGAIVLFCGLPILLLGLITFNLAQSLQAGGLIESQELIRSQIMSQVSRRLSLDRPRANLQALYLSNDSPTLARAEIQDRATRLVEQAGGRLIEALLISTPEQEADGTFAIQVTLDIENKGLFELLYAIETGLPLLDVSTLNITTGSAAADGTNARGLLHVEVGIQAHAKKSTG